MTRYAAEEGEDSPNYRRGLDRVANQVVKEAGAGDKYAWQVIANRSEGKPGQSVELSGEISIPLSGTVKYVDSKKDDV